MSNSFLDPYQRWIDESDPDHTTTLVTYKRDEDGKVITPAEETWSGHLWKLVNYARMLDYEVERLRWAYTRPSLEGLNHQGHQFAWHDTRGLECKRCGITGIIRKGGTIINCTICCIPDHLPDDPDYYAADRSGVPG